jgi:hypothetical protein
VPAMTSGERSRVEVLRSGCPVAVDIGGTRGGAAGRVYARGPR